LKYKGQKIKNKNFKLHVPISYLTHLKKSKKKKKNQKPNCLPNTPLTLHPAYLICWNAPTSWRQNLLHLIYPCPIYCMFRIMVGSKLKDLNILKIEKPNELKLTLLCRGKNVDVDISNIRILIRIIRLSLLGICIRIMRLLSVFTQLLNVAIIHYLHVR